MHIFRPKNIGNLGIPLNKMASCRRSAKSSASLSFAELNLNCPNPAWFYSEMFHPYITVFRLLQQRNMHHIFCLSLFHFKYFIGNKAQSQHSSSRNLYKKSLMLAWSAAPKGLETSIVSSSTILVIKQMYQIVLSNYIAKIERNTQNSIHNLITFHRQFSTGADRSEKDQKNNFLLHISWLSLGRLSSRLSCIKIGRTKIWKLQHIFHTLLDLSPVPCSLLNLLPELVVNAEAFDFSSSFILSNLRL